MDPTTKASIDEQIREGNARLAELFKDMPELEGDWEYILEGLKIDIAIEVTKAMSEQDISSAELARRMGVEPPVITRLRRHTGNVQLQTLAKVAAALDRRVTFKMTHKDEDVVVEKLKPRKNKAKAEKPELCHQVAEEAPERYGTRRSSSARKKSSKRS